MDNKKNIKNKYSREYASLYKKSAEYRNFVLLCEVGAQLHDLGKLSRLFVLSKAKNTNIKDFHGQILFIDYEKIPQPVKEFIFVPLWMFFEDELPLEPISKTEWNNSNNIPSSAISKSGKNAKNTATENKVSGTGIYKNILQNPQNSISMQHLDTNVPRSAVTAFLDFKRRFEADPLSTYYAPLLSAPYIKDIPLNIALSHFICAHHGCSRCLLQNYLRKPCAFDESQAVPPLRIDTHPLIKLLKTVDHLDASNPSNKGKQELFNLYRDDFFFGETRLPFERFEEMRFSFYRELGAFLQALKDSETKLYKGRNLTPQAVYFKNIEQINAFVKHLAEKYFTNALSETRRFGNDITLFDHSLATASFFKAFLYAHLVLGKAMPDSFFTVRFRVMKIRKISSEEVQAAQKWNSEKPLENLHTPSKQSDMGIKHFLENEIACCNAIAETDNYYFFLVPFMHNNNAFIQFLQTSFSENIVGAIGKNFDTGKNKKVSIPEILELELLPANDFAKIFDGTAICGKPLKDVLKKFRNLKAKDFADISEGYTEKQAISDVKRVVYFALLRKKERILSKLNSSKKHLANLYNGSLHDEKNLIKYFKKEGEVNRLKKHLDAFISMDKIKKMYGWRSSKDAEESVYDFFNTVLSPVRPPSPVAMSFYFLQEFNRAHSFKKLAEHFLIRRPLVLGRVLALFRTLKAEFCIKMKND
jgi:predicted transcriptional regulator